VPRIGLLGGTFNPPHIGHLLCAGEAYAQLSLDRVLLVPVHTPPHKPVHDDPGVEVRLELCRVASSGDARLAVSPVEADRPGLSYTAETLRELREAAPEDELTLIMGGDVARTLPSWREPEVVFELAAVAVAERRGARRSEIARELTALRGGARVTFFDMPRIDVSSTLVRVRVAAGQPIRYLVPDEVARYIEAHGLYRSPVLAG